MQNHTVLGIQPFLYALQCLRGLTGLLANASHDAHALRLNEDLALSTLLAANRLAKSIVGAAEPCAVPARGQGRLFHAVHGLAGRSGFIGKVQVVAQFGVLVAVLDEHARNEHAFGHRAFAGTGDLEALARVLRETVQVQAVVPVGAANERQAVGPRWVTVKLKLRRRCSIRLCALLASLSKGTCSSRIDQSPVSRR